MVLTMAEYKKPHIEIVTERRPCYVDGRKAMFHTWEHRSEIIIPSPMVGGHQGGVAACVFAIVEFEDGTVASVLPQTIHFADGGGFQDVAFFPLNKDGDPDE